MITNDKRLEQRLIDFYLNNKTICKINKNSSNSYQQQAVELNYTDEPTLKENLNVFNVNDYVGN